MSPPSQPSRLSPVVSLVLTHDLNQRLDKAAKRLTMKRSEIVRAALVAYLKSRQL